MMDDISDITLDTYTDKITFGIDLAEAANSQLEFLRETNQHPNLFKSSFLRKSLIRYEKYWLPLASKHTDKILTAPLDIEWIWHCHLLAPVEYIKDCNEITGKQIDHKLLDQKEREKLLEVSKQLWKSAYPDEAFEIALVSEVAIENGEVDFESKISYDILKAAERQSVFNYQVSLPHFSDKVYLKNAVARYQKMLYLKLTNPKTFLVPCYDMDLIWHTHMLHPSSYKTDTEKLFGKIFNHDDSVTDRSPGSKLNKADERTRALWRESFDDHFPAAGAMYRGDPPMGQLYDVTLDEIAVFSTKKANVQIDNLGVEGIPEEMKKFKLKLSYVASDKEGPVVTTVKGPSKQWDKKKCGQFVFDTKHYNCIKFKLLQVMKPLCFGTSEQMGQNVYHLLPIVESLRGENKSNITETIILDEEKGYKVSINANVNLIPKPGPSLLFLKNGNFEQRYCIMPEHIKQMWGPIPLPSLPPGRDNHCLVASHK